MRAEPYALTCIKGVGEKIAEHLAKLNLYHIQDLLFHLPLRYEDRTKITPIAHARAGDRILVEGHIQKVSIIARKTAQMMCQLTDGTGMMTLRFFHFNADQLKRLQEGAVHVRCFGEVREGLYHQLEMVHPEYHVIEGGISRLPLTDRLSPIYPTVQGIGQSVLRRLVKAALLWLDQHAMAELLPPSILVQHGLPSITAALHYIHAPPQDADQALLQMGTHPMQRRLAFEELLAHQLSLYRLRQQKKNEMAWPIHVAGCYQKKLLAALPFQFTQAQYRVLSQIEADLRHSSPMLRLVQGDVGSGKTLVAACAALCAIEAGFQVALMAPTELLAEQHAQNFKTWCDPLSIHLGVLTGSQSVKVKQEQLQGLASGDIQLVIGTHALFQKDVVFKQLALIIIDEQHRFGVQQRMALFNKGVWGDRCPHQLVMTATPIPRTLAMTAYADLDCSIIDELPPGRLPVQTVLIASTRRDEVIERVRVNCKAQRQVYWVCTLIEESDVLQCQAAAHTADTLQQLLGDVRVGLVHGRLKSAEKEAVMQAFKAGSIDVLVATTVIEVGVDVPNASLMIIENPERLGLAQLHQLRGRVGRGSLASYCVLLYAAPLSMLAEQRLKIMRDSTDGFYIAEEDLKLRGPGELLGVRQSGLMNFKVANLIRDQALIDIVNHTARILIEQASPCIALIIQRWLAHQLKYTRS